MFKKCQVVILPTNRKAVRDELFLDGFGILEKAIMSGCRHNAVHLYILSDEDPKIGDYGLDPGFDEPFRIKKDLASEDCFIDTNDNIRYTYNDPHWVYKVIATTDSTLTLPLIPNEFIKTFIKAYNEQKSIQDVMVEYQEYYIAISEYAKEKLSPFAKDLWVKDSEGLIPNSVWLRHANIPTMTNSYGNGYKIGIDVECIESPKLNEDNTIHIKVQKETFSREEVIDLCMNAYDSGRYDTISKDIDNTFSTWILKNFNL